MTTASNGVFHFDTYETKLSNTTLTEHFTTKSNEYVTFQPIRTSLTILLARLFKINCSTHR